MNKKALSYLLIIAAASCWGLISIATRSLAELGLSQMMIILVRGVVTSVFLGAILLVKDRSALRIKLKDIWCFVGTGIFSVVFFNYCYFSAINAMDASVAVVLLYTSPIFVVLISAPLFKERITPAKIAAVVLVLFGAACSTGIIGSGNALPLNGLLMGLGAGLGYALYSIFSRCAFRRGYGSTTVTFYTFAFTMLGTLPLIDYSTVSSITVCPALWGYCLFFGLLCCLIPYLMYTEGLKFVENGVASVVASWEIVAATLVGVLFWGESLSALNVTGVLLVIAGIAVMNVKLSGRTPK